MGQGRGCGVYPQFSELNPQFDGGRLSYTPTRDADTVVGRP